ncbi:hypothetical protein BD410DRAFT_773626 [Rickenella mellea]|uniref:NACHT domain-containing protein n=1 Tax=Rickenella mellea TaxID=50990 RepID=A0A4Y7PXE3_9AGAM|nr:hypothetical protein BD410DRAFT_773626 [Rickenella mellea]
MSKLLSKIPTRSNKQVKHACTTLVNGLQTTLTVAKEVAGNVGVPGLQAGISALLVIIDVAKKTSQNVQDIEQLAKHIDSLCKILSDQRDGRPLSPDIIARIQKFSEVCTATAEKVQKMASRSRIERMINYNADAQTISGHIRTITLSLECFTVETNLAIEGKVDAVGDNVKAVGDDVQVVGDSVNVVGDTVTAVGENVKVVEGNVKVVGDSVTAVGDSVKVVEDGVKVVGENVTVVGDNVKLVGDNVKVVAEKLERVTEKFDSQDVPPPHVMSAVFDYKDRSPCMEGTRVAVLDEIYSWIGIKGHQHEGSMFRPRPRHDEDSAAQATSVDQHIFWINGPAGTGKTTIAYTVADTCRRHRVLGASFFCSRDDTDCSNPKHIFPTIAYQLGKICAEFQKVVTEAVKSNLDIGKSSVPYQLEELIIKPLCFAKEKFPQCVVVLDALDEFKDSDITSTILSALSHHIAELSLLKILITSRPEQGVITAFQLGDLPSATQRLNLHEIRLDIVQYDIQHYLTSNLASLSADYEWPSLSNNIYNLAHKSSGLFIFAVTAVRFIKDRNYSDPKGQLESLLCATSTVSVKSSPHYHLDQLYTQILTCAFPDISLSLVTRLKKVLGSIVLLQDPLSPHSLARLLNLQPNTVRQTLLHLHSMIIVPDNDSQVIQLIHPSFFDFITNSTRCSDLIFFVDTLTQHTMMTFTCLETMKCLKRDMCGIANSNVLNKEISDLPMLIATHIPSHLRYACRHWAFHLSHSIMSNSLLNIVKEFSIKFLLYWIEVCCLLDNLQSCTCFTRYCKAGTIELLDDCEHFINEFLEVLRISALLVYHSALLFTPQQTLLYKTYRNEILFSRNTVSISHFQTHKDYSNGIQSVAFSPDGRYIVSGSYNGTIQLWDAVSGAYLKTLNGHLHSIQSVAFSPDGIHLISGSDNGTVQLWDIVKGVYLNTFNSLGYIESVVFSPDGKYIMSASNNGIIQLWDVVSYVHLNTFNSHSNRVMTFSPDDVHIIPESEFYDGAVQLWHTINGVDFKIHEIHSKLKTVAFSPDSINLASGFDNGTIQLWDIISSAHLCTLNGCSYIKSVAFSLDCMYIVSGSVGNIIQVWNIISGKCIHQFEGNSWSASFVASSIYASQLSSLLPQSNSVFTSNALVSSNYVMETEWVYALK